MTLQDALLVVLMALALALYAAVATVLVRRYLRGRDVGFIWLGVAGVVWPLLSTLLSFGERLLVDRAMRGEAVFFPFSLIQHGQMSVGDLDGALTLSRQIIGVALLLVAVFYLSKARREPDSLTV